MANILDGIVGPQLLEPAARLVHVHGPGSQRSATNLVSTETNEDFGVVSRRV
jgi:hypothetical protein